MPQPKQPTTVEDFLELIRKMNEDFKRGWQPEPKQTKPAEQESGGPSVNIELGGGEAATGAAGTEGGIGGVGTPSGGEAGGMGGGLAAIIGAIIGGQHLLSRQTDRKIEGQKTDDVFSGSFATEPWFAFLGDKLGLGPSAGEKFDAAAKNKDKGKALKRLPAAVDYWGNPINSWLAGAGEAVGTKVGGKKTGKVASTILNPIGALLGLFGK